MTRTTCTRISGNWLVYIPAVVLGGYGKDFHKYTERLNYSYNFEILPDLYEKAIIKLFKNGK